MWLLAPARLKDLSLLLREVACGGCRTCWGNAMGVLQQGDLHSFWQKGVASSKPKWEQKNPLFPVLFPSSLQETSQLAGLREIGEVKGKGLLDTETPHPAQAAPELRKAEEAGEDPGDSILHHSHGISAWLGWVLGRLDLSLAQFSHSQAHHSSCFAVAPRTELLQTGWQG